VVDSELAGGMNSWAVACGAHRRCRVVSVDAASPAPAERGRVGDDVVATIGKEKALTARVSEGFQGTHYDAGSSARFIDSWSG
jgi:hypothetical protein